MAPRARRGATEASHAPRRGTRIVPLVTTSTFKDGAARPLERLPPGRRSPGPFRRRTGPSPWARRGSRTRRAILCEGVVRLHDLLHQLVADDVPFVEVDERYAFDISNHL